MNEKERQAMWKERHLKALAELGFTGSFLTLRRLEERANRAAVRYCNGEISSEQWELSKWDIIASVSRLFKGGNLPKGFFINGDPRGYALKINSGNEAGQVHHPEYIPAGLHTDWGGYGILAPEEF